MSNSVIIKVLPGYKPSNTIQTLTPADGQLLLEYGEHLLIEHRKTVKNVVADDAVRSLNKQIASHETVIQELHRTQDQQKVEYEKQINALLESKQHDIKSAISVVTSKYEELKGITDHKLHLEQQKYTDLKKHYETTIANMHQGFKDTLDAKLYEERCEWRLKLNQTTTESEQAKIAIRVEVAQRYSEQIQQLTAQLISIKEELDQSRMDKEAALIEQRNSLLLKLDPLTKLYSSSAIEKGQSGETLIQNILSQLFTTCVIENVGQTGHTGDILFKLAELGVNALIEVKNKALLRIDDVNKFHCDIMDQSEKINCALFISINTPNIPTKGNFAIDYRGDKPVIYMHMQSADMVKYAIQMISLMVRYASTNKVSGGGSVDNQHYIVELIGEIYNNVKQGSAKIHRMKLTIAQLSRLANDTAVMVGRSVDNIISFYTKYDTLKGGGSEVKEVDNIGEEADTKYSPEHIAILVDFVKEKQVIPTREQISKMLKMSEVSIRKRGGVRDIKKILKQHIHKKKDEPAVVIDDGCCDDDEGDKGD